jgi:hypothetical protein
MIVLMQENKTPDFYFPTLARWGADVLLGDQLLESPPLFDQPHDRNAWVHYKMGDYPAVALQINNDTVIPFYSWLAKQFTFCDHHFGVGANSTPGHMLAIGGQTPTLRNPPQGTHPVWNLPTIFKHVERGGHTWAAVPNQKYPIQYYAELNDPVSAANILTPEAFLTKASTGTLPDFCMLWGPDGYDEHPPYKDPRDLDYIKKGHDLTWERVDAVVRGGGWKDTVFLLTWDDWGGYADHVQTPNAETAVDDLHPAGFQAIGGSRIPLILFGGPVKQGVESTWHSHACILKTVIDVFGLDPFGIPRVDTAASLTDQIDTTQPARPTPPPFGAVIVQPEPPQPTPAPVAPAPWGGSNGQPLRDLLTNDHSSVPAPSDAVVHAHAPKAPMEVPTSVVITNRNGSRSE